MKNLTSGKTILLLLLISTAFLSACAQNSKNNSHQQTTQVQTQDSQNNGRIPASPFKMVTFMPDDFYNSNQNPPNSNLPDNDTDIPQTYQSCTLDDITVAHNDNRDFFSQLDGPDCNSYMQNRTCNDGTLSGDDSYQYASCTCDSNYGTSCEDPGIVSCGAKIYYPEEEGGGVVNKPNQGAVSYGGNTGRSASSACRTLDNVWGNGARAEFYFESIFREASSGTVQCDGSCR